MNTWTGSSLPGYRCSIGARWGRRSSPPGCWPRPRAALRPAGKAPEPAQTTKSRTTARKRRTTRTTDGWKTWCCFWKTGGRDVSSIYMKQKHQLVCRGHIRQVWRINTLNKSAYLMSVSDLHFMSNTHLWRTCTFLITSTERSDRDVWVDSEEQDYLKISLSINSYFCHRPFVSKLKLFQDKSHPSLVNMQVHRCASLLGLASPGVGGSGGGEGLGEGGGQSRGGVAGVVPGQTELSAELEVVVLDGLVARLQTGRPPALLHLHAETLSLTADNVKCLMFNLVNWWLIDWLIDWSTLQGAFPSFSSTLWLW